MEIKAKLLKPYTEIEKLDFLVEYNHKLGCKIAITETALEAWGYTQEELENKEKERIQELFMTRSDFFDGTIQAWGVGEDELFILVQGLLSKLPIENVKKLMAINNFKNALNFYRKHDLFKMLVDVPISLGDNIEVTITDENLDRFFDEVKKGNKENAWQFLPKPVIIENEEITDET